MIAYQRPHHATWLKARDLIRSGAIGTVRQVQMDDGGNLLNTNSHNIRLALFLLDEPRAEWVLRVPPVLWDVIRGAGAAESEAAAAGWRLYPPSHFPAADGLAAPAAFREQVRHLPALLRGGRARAVVVRGMPGSDRLRVLGAVARGLGRRVLEVPAPRPSYFRRNSAPPCSRQSLPHESSSCRP